LERYPLYALSFDGVDDYVRVPNSPSLHPSSAVSVEAWIKTSVNQSSAWIVTKYYSAGFGEYLLGVVAGALRFTVVIGGSSVNYNPTFNYYDGRWHHVVGVYDGSYLRVYADGVQLPGSLAKTGSIDSTTYDVVVGSGHGAAGYFWSGLVALPKIYNRALSLAEIQRNMRNPLNPVRDGLVLFLPMLEGVGTSVRDFSGYGNNGTIYGAVWRDLAKYEVQPP
jgi:hypothetical protein